MKYILCKTSKEKFKLLSALEWSDRLRAHYHNSPTEGSVDMTFPVAEIIEDPGTPFDGTIATFYKSGSSCAYGAEPFEEWWARRQGRDPAVLKGHLRLMSALGRIPEAAGCIKTIKANPNALVAPSVETDGRYSYARSKEDKHNSKRRVKTSLQKILRKLGNEEPDHILAKVAGDLYPLLWPSLVKILKGPDISEFYYENRSSLPSCMTDRDATEMYAISPCCSLAVYEKDGVGLARCMVFDTDQGDKVHSRIYFSGGKQEHKGVLLEYFEKHGIKEAYQNEGSYSITCTIPDSGFVPYMDTFRRTDDEPSPGATVTFKDSGDFEACCTNGDIEGLDRCVSCGYVGNDLAHWNDDHYCEDCINEVSFTCENCGYRRDNDDMVTVDGDVWCAHCANNNAHRCEHCEEYHSESTSANLDEQEEWCSSCIENAGLTYVECCSGYTADAVEVDGTYYCEDCAPKEEEEGEPVRPEGEIGECRCIEEPVLSEVPPKPRTAGDLKDGEVFREWGGKVLAAVSLETRRTHEMPEEFYINCHEHPINSGWIGGTPSYWVNEERPFRFAVATPASCYLVPITQAVAV